MKTFTEMTVMTDLTKNEERHRDVKYDRVDKTNKSTLKNDKYDRVDKIHRKIP